jgi:hypothetical protein
MEQTKKRLPIWLYLFILICLLSSAVGVYGGYFNGQFFYAEFSADLWNENLVKHLAGMWASKNLAFIIVLLYSLIRKKYQWLAAIFLFKFISDTVDILYVNIYFREGPAASVMNNLMSWALLALPSAIAVYYLSNRNNT